MAHATTASTSRFELRAISSASQRWVHSRVSLRGDGFLMVPKTSRREQLELSHPFRAPVSCFPIFDLYTRRSPTALKWSTGPQIGVF